MAHCAHCGKTLRLDSDSCPDCGAARPEHGFPSDDRIGELVAGGQYRIVGRLGEGGFGVVYEAETVVGGLRRALKVLGARWAKDAAMRERFTTEASILEGVHHPNIARCYAAGILSDAGELYLLLELVRGTGLHTMLRSEGPFEPRRAVRLAKQIASGLQVAHGAGVVHRDLKPDNVLVIDPGTPGERVKLVDFGIAKALEDGVARTMTIAGTPEYMAPEQFEPGRALDATVDLYALGALLFALLTGQPPHKGESVAAVRAQHSGDGELGPRPSVRRKELESLPALDLLVASLLSGSPSKRPASADVVVEELARIEHAIDRGTRKGAEISLLGALCAVPSESSWLALQQYLAEQEDPAVVAQAERLLGSWPHGLRRATNALWERSKRGSLHRLWPLVRDLDLSGRDLDDEAIEHLAQSPALARLTSLDLSRNRITNNGVEALAASPHLAKLERLDLSGNRISSRGLEALVAGTVGALRELRLADNGIGTRGAEALAKSECALEVLDLSRNDLGPEALTALAEAECLRGLQRLMLSGNRIGPDGAAALAVSSTVRSLQCVDLTRNAIGPSGAAALALSDALRSVRRLSLAGNTLGREGLKLLLASRTLERLQELDLGGNELGPAGAMVLASSPIVRRLWALRVQGNGLGDAGVAALLSSANLSGLRELELADNGLTASAVSLLGDAPPQLDALDLSRNPLGAAGAAALADPLGRLRLRRLALAACGLDGTASAELLAGVVLDRLDLSDNPIGVDGARSLSMAPAVSRLLELAMDRCGLGARGLGALVEALGGLRSLSVASNRLGDDGVGLLVANGARMPRLETLVLDDNDISSDGAASLATSALARHLVSLSLDHNPLGDRGAETLASGASWHALTELGMRHTEIGGAGAATLETAETLGSVQRVDLSENVIAGGADMHSLHQDHVALMEQSFALVAPQGADLAERFYDELFARYPAVAPLFANTDMVKQQRHLLQSLAMTIDNLRNPGLLEKNLAALGARHRRYGVVPTHYFAVASTLLDVLREVAGDAWSPELEAAWSEGLRAVSETMMGAADPIAPTRDLR